MQIAATIGAVNEKSDLVAQASSVCRMRSDQAASLSLASPVSLRGDVLPESPSANRSRVIASSRRCRAIFASRSSLLSGFHLD